MEGRRRTKFAPATKYYIVRKHGLNLAEGFLWPRGGVNDGIPASWQSFGDRNGARPNPSIDAQLEQEVLPAKAPLAPPITVPLDCGM